MIFCMSRYHELKCYSTSKSVPSVCLSETGYNVEQTKNIFRRKVACLIRRYCKLFNHLLQKSKFEHKYLLKIKKICFNINKLCWCRYLTKNEILFNRGIILKQLKYQYLIWNEIIFYLQFRSAVSVSVGY